MKFGIRRDLGLADSIASAVFVRVGRSVGSFTGRTHHVIDSIAPPVPGDRLWPGRNIFRMIGSRQGFVASNTYSERDTEMYLTHTFASRETLSRAHDLLERLGFRHRFTESGVPRIVVMDGVDRMSAALMLINVVENGDPNGFPGVWDQPRHFGCELNTTAISAGRDDQSTTRTANRSTLGWHPLD